MIKQAKDLQPEDWIGSRQILSVDADNPHVAVNFVDGGRLVYWHTERISVTSPTEADKVRQMFGSFDQ